VNTVTKPVSEKNLAFDRKVTIGLTAGRTVKYARPTDRTVLIKIASALIRRLTRSSYNKPS
jgi:hypothetical protein